MQFVMRSATRARAPNARENNVKRGTKRFYNTVAVTPVEGGFAVTLDGKAMRTPASASLILTHAPLAEAIAKEWHGQAEWIEPDTMPLTRYANTVIDRVAPRREQLVAELAKFAGHDLLCYREAVTTELMQRQAAAWDPWLAWAAEHYGAELAIGQGVTHIEQSPEALERLRRVIAAHDAHRLAVLHAAITITGSAVLGLAFVGRVLDAEAAFAASRVDEAYQAELWGRDGEAEAREARLLADLKAAECYLSLLPSA
jgi:chaperone required for assembly of F1-ATPase